MIAEEWEPTMSLRWRGRVLEQRWRRKCIEYREYNGNPVKRQCEWYQSEWRPIEKSQR